VGAGLEAVARRSTVSEVVRAGGRIVYLGCDGGEVFPRTTGETWTRAAESNSGYIQRKGMGDVNKSVWDNPEDDDGVG
jgi:hypothetical protein